MCTCMSVAEKMKQTEWEEFDFNWRNVLAVEVPENLPEESSGVCNTLYLLLIINDIGNYWSLC